MKRPAGDRSPTRDATPLADAAAKAARHRVWHWCRRQNGFSDQPVWRLIARDLGVPLVMVQAFVNRLEEFANAADHRGSVGAFEADEFAAALDIRTDEAARLFAALERRGWIAFEHVATFHDRNPDREDDTAAERKRRQRARQKAMLEIARQAAAGLITEDERRRLELEVLVDARLSTGHGRHDVTPASTGLGTSPTQESGPQESQPLSALPPGHGGHIVTPRDIVTVTPEQSTVISSETVDNSGGATAGGAAGGQEGQAIEGAAVGEQAAAELWLATDGKRLIIERMQIVATLAETYLERWRRDLADDVQLKLMIEGAEAAGYVGPRWHTIVTDQVRRRKVINRDGPQLPLVAKVELKRRTG